MRFTLLFTLIFLLFNLHDVNAQCVAKAGLNDTICAGGSVTLGGTSTGNGTITYAWTPSAGLSCDDCASPIATPSSTTTYHLTITDSDGCSSSDDVTVVVNPLPNSGFTFSNNNVCANLPIVFTANSIVPGYSYSWNFGNPASGGNNTASTATTIHEFVSYGTGSTTYTVTLTVTTPQGCQTSTTQTVTINNLPQATLMDPISSFKNCDGTNFNMTIYDATPNTGTNYQIIWGDGTSDYNSTTAPSGESHTYTISDIFDLYYIVTGTNGCIDTAQYIVSNITNPAIGAANPGATTGCGPLTLCFPLSSYSANHHSTIYIVDYGDNTPVDTFTHAALPPQICHTYTESSCGKPGNAFTFEIQAQNQCDISTTTVTPIRIYTGPQPEFANPPVACVNTPVSFTNNTIPGYNTTCATTTIYTWDFGDGTANLITPIKTNPTHTYTSPGTYTITLSSQNSCGTFSIAHTICIEAIPNPLYDITPLTSCVPFNVVVTNNSDTADMCEFTFNWQLLNFSSSCQSAQNFSFDNGTTATTWHPQFLYESAGEYTMRLSITNSCGTFNKDTLVKGLDIPRIALAPLDSICLGNSVTPNLTLNDCYDPINTYSWTFNSGTPTASSDENPGPISYTMSGTFPITVEVTNICGSVDSTKTITVFDPPVADAGPDVSYCSGGSAVLGGATAVTGVSYQWSPTTNLTSTNQPTATANPTNTGDTPVIIQYVLTASTASTCLDRDTVNVTVNPLPHLTVNNPTICLGDNTQLIVSATTTPMNYLWNTTADLSCLPCDNPTLSPSVTTTYTVVATNSFGCIDSISSTVTVNPLPVVNAGNDSTLCDQPIPFNLTGTPAGGSWSGSVNV
ncbi:MAG TPA: PKD domain-containing protein, partial [Taishania sp.]|nr:PKD domain-containing protein [Taishania sp.]